jgi:tRNA threonylcarbamoyladenosine biosynthesis protein TsaB
MLVLALDTTTREGSCALARDDRVLLEQRSDASKPQAERLPADLMALLDRTGVTLADIDVYAVSTGPGSFTGLRVGIATMQGLAFAAEKPLIGVSALDALHDAALHGESDGTRPAGSLRVATWIDAWRGDVYAALYEDGDEIGAPRVAHPDQLLAELGARPTCFIGDGAGTYAAAIRAALGDVASFATPVAPPLAGTIARLATGVARSGELPPPHAIRPLYIHR